MSASSLTFRGAGDHIMPALHGMVQHANSGMGTRHCGSPAALAVQVHDGQNLSSRPAEGNAISCSNQISTDQVAEMSASPSCVYCDICMAADRADDCAGGSLDWHRYRHCVWTQGTRMFKAHHQWE